MDSSSQSQQTPPALAKGKVEIGPLLGNFTFNSSYFSYNLVNLSLYFITTLAFLSFSAGSFPNSEATWLNTSLSLKSLEL